MILAYLANLVVILHFGFILFVVTGALLVWRWPRAAWVHVPAALWGVLIEFRGWVCPLTPLENRLRQLAGEAGYGGGFIEHYLIPIVYPTGLTPSTQLLLGLALALINVSAYGGYVIRRRMR
ncbi:MAG TPA: DUF2784 domain-containing protein [Gemmatimonadales bacterium]